MVDIRCEYLATFGYLAILNVSKTLPGRRSHGVARVLHSITTTCAALLRQNMSALHEGQDPSIVVRMWFAGDNAGVSRRRSGSRCKGAAAVVRVVPGVARRPGPHVGVRGCHSCPHEVRRHPRPIAHVWFAVSHDKLRHAAVNRRFWLRVYCGRALRRTGAGAAGSAVRSNSSEELRLLAIGAGSRLLRSASWSARQRSVMLEGCPPHRTDCRPPARTG